MEGDHSPHAFTRVHATYIPLHYPSTLMDDGAFSFPFLFIHFACFAPDIPISTNQPVVQVTTTKQVGMNVISEAVTRQTTTIGVSGWPSIVFPTPMPQRW